MRIEQSLAADGAIASFSSNFFPFSLNADRAPQLKASVRLMITFQDDYPTCERTFFHDIDVQPGTKTLRLPPPEEFLWQYVRSTPLAAVVARANDKSRAALERDVVAKLQEFVKNGALIFQHGLVVATARK